MATNSSRSQNQDLREGMTDGKYRKVRPNTEEAPWSGSELTRANRMGLHPWFYGFLTTEIPLEQRVFPGR